MVGWILLRTLVQLEHLAVLKIELEPVMFSFFPFVFDLSYCGSASGQGTLPNFE